MKTVIITTTKTYYFEVSEDEEIDEEWVEEAIADSSDSYFEDEEIVEWREREGKW